jgi:hypothetical protein
MYSDAVLQLPIFVSDAVLTKLAALDPRFEHFGYALLFGFDGCIDPKDFANDDAGPIFGTRVFPVISDYQVIFDSPKGI